MITLTESERLRARVVGAAEQDRPTRHYWRPLPWADLCAVITHAVCGHKATDHEPMDLRSAELCTDCKAILMAEGWTQADFDADVPPSRGAR
jgi:hypothetical protein